MLGKHPLTYEATHRMTRPVLALGGGDPVAIKVGRPNGSDAKLHGQGPRAEAGAARGAPACEARECAPRDAARF